MILVKFQSKKRVLENFGGLHSQENGGKIFQKKKNKL